MALKVLSTPLGGATEWVRNEGRSLARLEHPGVVRVHALEAGGGQPFLVMDLVRGPSLREVLGALRERAGQPEAGVETGPDARAAAARLEGIAARCELVARIAEALAATLEGHLGPAGQGEPDEAARPPAPTPCSTW